MNNHEIRLVGNGGQGVILATVILAEAALLTGKHTAQSQAYGPEARGSICKAETIISDVPIGYTKVTTPTFFLALTQRAIDHHAASLSEDCIVMIDSSLKFPETLKSKRRIALPFIKTAIEVVGKVQTTNIVAVACINEFLNIASHTILEHAVMARVPKGTQAVNLIAMRQGFRLAHRWQKEHTL